MKTYIKKLINLVLFFIIFLGIPYFSGWVWMIISWIPAVASVSYLNCELES